MSDSSFQKNIAIGSLVLGTIPLIFRAFGYSRGNNYHSNKNYTQNS